MPAHAELIHHFEDFCGTVFTSSEQHIDLRKSRQLRGNQDVEKLREWLKIHSPLSENPELMSKGTGVVVNNMTNCDEAVRIGT